MGNRSTEREMNTWPSTPPIHLATLILPRQDLDTRGQAPYGENLAFNGRTGKATPNG